MTMITPINLASGATASLLLAARTIPDNNIAIQNQGTATIYISYDGSADVTVAGGAKPGIAILAGETLFLGVGVQDRMAMSNAIYGVQTSGAPVTGTIHRT